MSIEVPSDAELDMIKWMADATADRAVARLGDVPTDVEFDFCEKCPLLDGHSPNEVAEARSSFSVETHAGIKVGRVVVGMQIHFNDGTNSKPFMLHVFNEDIFVGPMVEAARAIATQKTQDCESPKGMPRFLGPFALSSCRALRKI